MTMPVPPRAESWLRAGIGLLLIAGCWLVLQPFLPAILFSAAIAVSTWPAHRWLLHRLPGRSTIASVISCLIVALLVIAPTVVVVMSLGDGLAWLLKLIDEWRLSGPHELPAWLLRIPLIGEAAENWLREGGAGGSGRTGPPALTPLIEPARRLVVAAARALGNGIVQALLAVLLLFFFYREGDRLGGQLYRLAHKIGGVRAATMLETVRRTVVGVMTGVIGTALAQSAMAIVGFAIAGVPQPLLLGSITFVLSMVPIGPPLIWGGAAVWLLRNGEAGRALFMALYGLLGISSVDNVIKPFLISRSSHLPFAMTFMGIIGGVIAFGVAGVFIGPTLLALVTGLAGESLLEPDRGAVGGLDK